MRKFNEWVKDKKVAIIMRGIPGSGKSYTARQMLAKYGGGNPCDHIFSTDDFWVQSCRNDKKKRELAGEEIDPNFEEELEREEYLSNFNPEKLGYAHKWNQRRFMQAIDQGISPVIVDNTNSKLWEMKAYVQYAMSKGYDVKIQEPESDWWQDHAHMLADKNKYPKDLEEFAKFLAGGMTSGIDSKYGGPRGNTHGVPLDVIRNFIKKYQHGITPDDFSAE